MVTSRGALASLNLVYSVIRSIHIERLCKVPSWLIQGVITSLTGAAIGFFARIAWDWFFSFRKSPYKGVWEDEIMNDEGVVVKHDSYKIKHNRRTNEITGTISRMYPTDQTRRRWKMIGTVDGGSYILFSFLEYGRHA